LPALFLLERGSARARGAATPRLGLVEGVLFAFGLSGLGLSFANAAPGVAEVWTRVAHLPLALGTLLGAWSWPLALTPHRALPAVPFALLAASWVGLAVAVALVARFARQPSARGKRRGAVRARGFRRGAVARRRRLVRRGEREPGEPRAGAGAGRRPGAARRAGLALGAVLFVRLRRAHAPAPRRLARRIHTAGERARRERARRPRARHAGAVAPRARARCPPRNASTPRCSSSRPTTRSRCCTWARSSCAAV
jgi:hypothetical protein